MDNPAAPAPYAYTLYSRDRYDPPVFPTLDALVKYLIQIDAEPYQAKYYPPAVAHYADGRSERVGVDEYLEEVEVDLAPILQQVDEGMAASLARYNEAFPTEADRAYHRRNRYSGDTWMHEQAKDDLVRNIAESRRWKWRVLP
jgi:hypothetical protein